MKHPQSNWLRVTMAALTVGAISGCQNTADGISKDSKVAAENTAEATEKAGEKAARSAMKAGAAVKEAGHNVTAALEVTPRVKTALTADSELNDAKNHIDVDSSEGVVHLKGNVTSLILKAKATKIAEKAIKDGGGTDKVQNHLEVKTP